MRKESEEKTFENMYLQTNHYNMNHSRGGGGGRGGEGMAFRRFKRDDSNVKLLTYRKEGE